MNTAVETPGHDAAFRAFKAAALEDESSYPNRTAFIGADLEGASHALWRYLNEGRPTVIVGADGSELLVIPGRPSWLDRLRRRIGVEVRVRSKEGPELRIQAEIGPQALDAEELRG